MEKKRITLSLIGIILISSLIIVLANKNNKQYIMQDGMMLALTLDGEEITSFPEGTNYRVDVNCENANAVWLVEEWKLGLEDITGNVVCDLDFTTRDSEDTLLNVVENITRKNEFVTGDYSKVETLNINEYGTPSMYSSDSYSSTSGTTISNAFEYNESEWNSIPDNLTSGTYYHFKFDAPEDGYYQMCYTLSNGSDYNSLYLSKNTTLEYIAGNSFFINASPTDTVSNCYEIGELTTSDYIIITQRAYSDDTNGISTLSFYFQNTTDSKIISTGNRYTGKEPKNWVWFNNEMWRIIGSIPTCTNSGCTTSENLIKIIRDESIGGLAYDAKASEYTGAWGSNTLYDLLNNYYFGQKNATGASPCFAYNDNGYALCNYTKIGIANNNLDFYGKMVKSVYWNVGSIPRSQIAANISYLSETKNTISGKVGLMSASDFGYASGQKSVYLSNLNNYEQNNWLHRDSAWTLTQFSSNNAITNTISGYMMSINTNVSYQIHPVVYLDPNVYVVSGDGSINYPYQITME